jgi:hypothetical protein
MALTTDFTGTYDYEREEGAEVGDHFLEGIESGYYRNADEYQQAVIKERNHWAKDTGFDIAGFADEFNKRTVPACLKAYGREIYL